MASYKISERFVRFQVCLFTEMMNNIKSSLNKLYEYCEGEKYKGWDVFDGLNSNIFKLSPFYRSQILRLAWIQLFKRSFINFRRIAFVPKGYNAKGLALFASGFVSMDKLEEAELLMNQLKGLVCSGYEGTCWGYNFDWQARAFYVPIGKPNIVTTVFVANAFLDYAEAKSKKQKAKSKKELDIMKIAEGACEFILKELVLFEDEEKPCFGYIPGEQARVHNANMLGAALLARVYSHTKNADYYEKSKKAMAYSIKALNPDYSWPYGELPHHQFIDNFHTGYNLVALKEWMDYTGNNTWKEELGNAYKYFLDTFWLGDGCPKYYRNSLYPVDIHCSAQGIVTCLKLKDYDNRSVPMAKKIAKWAINNMQDKEGFFYYQKTRWYTNKIPYIRWSQAWMFYALSKLSHECQNRSCIII
jgi:hypothetical protein